MIVYVLLAVASDDTHSCDQNNVELQAYYFTTIDRLIHNVLLCKFYGSVGFHSKRLAYKICAHLLLVTLRISQELQFQIPFC